MRNRVVRWRENQIPKRSKSAKCVNIEDVSIKKLGKIAINELFPILKISEIFKVPPKVRGVELKITIFPLFCKKRVFGSSKGSLQKACYFTKFLKKKHVFQLDPPPDQNPPDWMGVLLTFHMGGG